MSLPILLPYDVMKQIYDYLDDNDRYSLISSHYTFFYMFGLDYIHDINNKMKLTHLIVPHAELIGCVDLIHKHAIGVKYPWKCTMCNIHFESVFSSTYHDECACGYDDICRYCIKLVPGLFIICPTHNAEYTCKNCFDTDGSCTCMYM
jgi:hypothetical protein